MNGNSAIPRPQYYLLGFTPTQVFVLFPILLFGSLLALVGVGIVLFAPPESANVAAEQFGEWVGGTSIDLFVFGHVIRVVHLLISSGINGLFALVYFALVLARAILARP